MSEIKSVEDINKLNKDELCQKLKEYGVNVVITSTTEKFHRKRLARLMGVSKDETINNNNNIEKIRRKVSFCFY